MSYPIAFFRAASYWDGKPLAYRSSDSTTYFQHQDYLGTERMRTNDSGAVAASFTSLPWGDGYAGSIPDAGAGQETFQFAGMDQDTSSAYPISEHAQFRQYSYIQGRWLSPDPYDGSYDITNPQSLNRYAYVLNNPLSFVDPLGLIECYQTGGGWSVSAGGTTSSGFDPIISVCTSDGEGAGGGGGSGGGGGGGAGGAPSTGVPTNPCASAGNAPDPSAYVAAAQAVKVAAVTALVIPFASEAIEGAALLSFQRGGLLDAQPLGGSRAYGNYVYGAYLSASGLPLSVALAGANSYASVSNAQYPGFTMDPNYPAIPAANIANITNGYNAQQNGTLCHKD